MVVDGKKVPSKTSTFFDVHNPATGSLVALKADTIGAVLESAVAVNKVSSLHAPRNALRTSSLNVIGRSAF